MNKILLFFDLSKPVESINQTTEYDNDKAFRVFLKIIEYIIVYGVVYLIIKFGQFVLSLLMKREMVEIEIVYIVLPLLFFAEYGLSKIEPKKLTHIILFMVRATAKFGLIYGIDYLVMY